MELIIRDNGTERVVRDAVVYSCWTMGDLRERARELKLKLSDRQFWLAARKMDNLGRFPDAEDLSNILWEVENDKEGAD